jgi:hypothetical protein
VRQSEAIQHDLRSRYRNSEGSLVVGVWRRGIFGAREAGNRRAKRSERAATACHKQS